MNNFWEINKSFFSIIISAFIIGGFVYLAIREGGQPKISNFSLAPKIQTATPPTSLSPQTQIKTDSATNIAVCGASDNTIVTKVIDGDTVVVEGGYHVRLLGMDADEKGYPCYLQAKTRLEQLVLGKNVVLEKDKTDSDQYGRCLRYIFIGTTNVDVQLTKEGLAIARFYEPDVKYKAAITAAEQYAQQNKLGCKWSGNSQISN